MSKKRLPYNITGCKKNMRPELPSEMAMPCQFSTAEEVGQDGEIVYNCRRTVQRTFGGGIVHSPHPCLLDVIQEHPDNWQEVVSAPIRLVTPELPLAAGGLLRIALEP